MSLDFLIEMGWKSALIAGAALIAGLLLKSRSPEDRAAMLRLAFGLILLLPLISLMGPALTVESPIGDAAPAMVQTHAALPTAMPTDAAAIDRAAGEPAGVDPEFVIGLVYLAGLLILGLRLFGGYATLQRWTWAAREVDSPLWRDAFERARIAAGDRRGTRLLLSDSVPAPLSWGWAQPVILIDAETYDRPEDADAVLAHELAHVVRADWVALMASRLAVALFWFNPFVWYLEREMVQQSEEAADAKAVAEVEPAHYAQTLMSCVMHSRGGMVPANSIRPSRSGLSRRIYAVLDGRARAMRSGSRWTLAAMIGCIAFAAPLAAIELTAPEAPAAPLPPSAPAAPDGADIAIVTRDGDVPEAPLPPEPPAPPAWIEKVESAAARAHVAAEHAREKAEVHRTRDREMAHMAEALAGLDEEIEAATAVAFAEAGSARAIAVQARDQARHDMARGAVDLERGANELERGARQLAVEADRLHSRKYREEQIAKASTRGQIVTHQELIAAIPKMRNGSKEMLKNAQEMRRSAIRMRRGN